MNKKHLSLLVLAILLLLTPLLIVAVSRNRVYYTKTHLKTPYDYPGSVWKCDAPAITLTVGNAGSGGNVYDTSVCSIMVEGKEFQVDFYMDYPTRSYIERHDDEEASVIRAEDNFLMVGHCTFSPDEVVFRVSLDRLFDGQYKGQQLTLYRIDTESSH